MDPPRGGPDVLSLRASGLRASDEAESGRVGLGAAEPTGRGRGRPLGNCRLPSEARPNKVRPLRPAWWARPDYGRAHTAAIVAGTTSVPQSSSHRAGAGLVQDQRHGSAMDFRVWHRPEGLGQLLHARGRDAQPVQRAQQVLLEQDIAEGLVGMAECGVEGTPSAELAAPGDRVVGAHGAALVA